MIDPERATSADALEPLVLADWRRRVASLYAEVRTLAAADPAAAWEHWWAVRERLYREHPASPVPAPARASFRGKRWGYDARYRFDVRVEPATGAAAAAAREVPAGIDIVAPPPAFPTSDGSAMAFGRIGWLDVPFPGGTRRLGLYWLAGYAGGLFLPFRDETNGSATYGAGRYLLDGAKGADLGSGRNDPGTLVLDFNFAYQPSCAFDPRWTCPLAPPENRLDIPVEAGERIA